MFLFARIRLVVFETLLVLANARISTMRPIWLPEVLFSWRVGPFLIGRIVFDAICERFRPVDRWALFFNRGPHFPWGSSADFLLDPGFKTSPAKSSVQTVFFTVHIRIQIP
jgi:hypothetical protein